MDDWGREIRRLELYRWVAANGNEFPRAEIFGYEIDGRETQVFLRALELYARYLCYVYPDKDSPIPSGRRVHHGLIPDPTASEPVKSSPPDDLEFPLNRAKLSWWRVNPEQLLAWGYKPIP